jgi:hypothetical protein
MLLKSNAKRAISGLGFILLSFMSTTGLGALAVVDSDHWELAIHDPSTQLTIWQRPHIFGVSEFKAEIITGAPAYALIALFQDTESYPLWVDKGLFSQIIETHDNVSLTRTGIDIPWPLQNRDLVIESELTLDPNNCTVNVTSTNAPAKLPEDPKFVRIESFEAHWQAIPLSSNSSLIRYQGALDLKGPLTKKRLSDATRDSLEKTFINLRKQIALARYRSHLSDSSCEL